MRNLFDQYSHPENRLTHALVCCLGEDQILLKHFVRWLAGDGLPEKWKLSVLEQQLPGEEEDSEEEAEKRGLPDAWIHDGESWALIIESKIAAPISSEQLKRHRSTAERRGFERILLLAITTVKPISAASFPEVRFITWSEIYLWFIKQTERNWARRMVSYMEAAEAKMAASGYLKEGSLTVFSGIPFKDRHLYTYLEAKRVLSLALNELRKREDLKKNLGIDSVRKGRSAITGKEESSVWDFLWLRQAASEKDFTTLPHLTLSLNRDQASAMITLGAGLKPSIRRRLVEQGPKNFWKVITATESKLSESVANKGGIPRMYVTQRHFSSRRSPAIEDGRLEFDLRTSRKGRSPVRLQPEWWEAAFNLLLKRRSNMQIGIGAVFPYRTTSAVHSPQALNLFADAWLSCKPLLDLL
jgi:hypothetical protein